MQTVYLAGGMKSGWQSEILKDQAWIHKLEAEIQEYKEAIY